MTTISEKSLIRFTGMKLLAAQGLWFLIAVLVLATLLFALPVYSTHLHTRFPHDQALSQIGIAPGFRPIYYTVLDMLFITVYMLSGFLLFWGKRNHLMALLASVTIFLYPIRDLALAEILDFSASSAAIPAHFLEGLMGIALTLCMYLFPDGRFAAGWVKWAALVTVGLKVFRLAFPAAVLSLGGAADLVVFTLLPYVVALATQVYRYGWVADATQRQQLKWVLFSSVFAVAGLLAFKMADALNSESTAPTLEVIALHLIVTTLFRSVQIIVPLSMAASILRYRLWDIDFVINRSMVYGLLTVLLAVIFVVNLFIVSRVFERIAGGPLIAVAVTALIFGAIFQPVRRRLQRLIDQRFYGIGIDYQAHPPSSRRAAMPANKASHKSIGGYTDLEMIGQGGMGQVYAGCDSSGRRVAIKVLAPYMASDPDLRKRFEREGRILTGLDHPHIVRVYQMGEDEGVLYLAMEYLAGTPLDARLRQGGRLSLMEALPIAEGIAAALDYAHQHGLVHRDIKPSNVMIEGTRAILMDFGIARVVGAESRYTATGHVLGSLSYIAPEQIQATNQVDGRADIYAFGVMLYEMLTGQLPFTQENFGALLIAHLMQPPPDPRQLAPDLSPEVSAVVLQAMAKSPDKRFPTAGAMIATLRAEIAL